MCRLEFPTPSICEPFILTMEADGVLLQLGRWYPIVIICIGNTSTILSSPPLIQFIRLIPQSALVQITGTETCNGNFVDPYSPSYGTQIQHLLQSLSLQATPAPGLSHNLNQKPRLRKVRSPTLQILVITPSFSDCGVGPLSLLLVQLFFVNKSSQS